VALLEPDAIKAVAKSLLTPLIREMADGDHVNKTLQNQAVKVGNSIKAKIGDNEYSKLLLELQSRMNIKKLERKKQIAQDKVKNPMKAAIRKESLQKRKKEGLKRKKELIRENKIPKPKRKRMEDLF
jgi:U3 small nucleolar RNA-associated protein 20